MKTILLKLKGPMQSWGTSSHFETRNTDYYPSKSAVIGIIAASFGYKRDDDEKIQKLNELNFAIRIDQPGVLAKDYHFAIMIDQPEVSAKDYHSAMRCRFPRVSDVKLNKRYVTNRYYMEDAIFVVAISHADDQWIDSIYHALQNPYFTPFMGRRSCPLPADFIITVTNKDALDALQNLEWQAAKWYKRKHQNYCADIYADKDLNLQGIATTRNDRVVSFSQKERKFGPRFETRTSKDFTNGRNDASNSNSLDFYESI
ncbi:type I-E CRISPR-associated protein Cas5/CasD [Lactobacillus iners]|uniref:type I-E CRISPR-associated protein Cas5/CasD n=1 Tax=Lactobacillus iners TaxID=147802 RepID=UPI001F08D8CC|nr:type I-E CRISPR-associated protein Cas5/CasD [Lactobacillus iners]MCT7696057.1 type I-E CRISPR-associated protein Cas5/CasD [Lactobacillus iners]MCT7743695.1 type I-E CRISPR-associated protein Cas5/CasD [Lactobacillus iners]MCT7803747.1 type I-E CRISPR-associated protein Cas5/CasD [Lactobacillus iners]MCT7883741.1 type I-E CRISPR-associated protein Cas5/CasD [Lactobacillus iners]